MIAGSGCERLRLLRWSVSRHRKRAHVHTSAENLLLVASRYALDIRSQLSEQLIERSFLFILGTGFFFCCLARGLYSRGGGVEFVNRRGDVCQARRRGRETCVTG